MSYFYVHRSNAGSSTPCSCDGSDITCCGCGGDGDGGGGGVVSMGTWVGSDPRDFPRREPLGSGVVPVGESDSNWVQQRNINWGPCDVGRSNGQRWIPEIDSSELGDLSYYFIGDWSKFTEEDERRYRKQVIESDGFEVDSFPHMVALNAVCNLGPVEQLPVKTLESVTRCAEFALADYNANNDTDWEFSCVIRVNSRVLGGIEYLITFGAVSSSSQNHVSQEFQARVLHQAWNGNMEVSLVRPRKTN